MREEDGAVAVIVAILFVGLVGMGALVIDVGAMYWETRQLQNGADAAALAVAQDCAVDPCSDRNAVAQSYANDNSNDGASAAAVQFPGLDGTNSVTVTTTTLSDSGDGFLTLALAGVLGVETSTHTRSATARWGYFGGGNTVPLTISQCEWNDLTGGDPANLPTPPKTVIFHTPAQPGPNPCTIPPGLDSPGGFGWLDDSSGPCEAQVQLGTVQNDQGNSMPSTCSNSFFAGLIGTTVLMPVFTTVTGTGQLTYEIAGFAAMEIIGYRLGGAPAATSTPTTGIAAPCSNPARCIRGRFVAYYDLGSEPSTSAPNFGVSAIALSR